VNGFGTIIIPLVASQRQKVGEVFSEGNGEWFGGGGGGIYLSYINFGELTPS
jgi:hypothetical protein